MWIAHDQWMPDVVGLAKIKHQRRANQYIAEKCGQDCRPDDGMQPFDIQNVDRGCQCESSGCQHYAAEHVKTDPDSPGKLVIQVGGCTQALCEAQERGIAASDHQRHENDFPEGQAK